MQPIVNEWHIAHSFECKCVSKMYLRRVTPAKVSLTRVENILQRVRYYLSDTTSSAEMIDENGWFHTGNIGCWRNDSTLSNIFWNNNIKGWESQESVQQM